MQERERRQGGEQWWRFYSLLVIIFDYLAPRGVEAKTKGWEDKKPMKTVAQVPFHQASQGSGEFY